MRIRILILDPHWKKWIRIQVISLRFTKFFFKFFFPHSFILKFDEPFRNEEIFIISLSKVQILVLGVKKFFFFSFWLILALGSGSVDPHIFADPEPDQGSQKLADPESASIIYF